MSKVIFHVDLNAFFVTAEQIRDPSLKGKPILIGHSGRSGIVSTCSYEARKYGCHSGQPTFQALRLCPNAIILPPDYSYYKKLSDSFFAYLSRFTNLIEKASIDEAYLDMTLSLKEEKDPVSYCKKMQQGLLNETGLSCSIGVAPTKWLAKMGSDMKKPLGLVFIRRRDIPSILYPLPIESFWGIGKKTAPRLRNLGINTIGDLARHIDEKDAVLAKELGKFFFTVEEWIKGRGSDEIITTREDPKSIGVSETLMRDASTFNEVSSTIKEIAEELSRRAKKEKKKGKGITLQVKDTSFRLHSKATMIDEPSDDKDVIEAIAARLYQTYFEGMEIRLIGITLTRLSDPKKDTIQMSLWNYEQYEEQDKTKLLIHDLNRKLSSPSLKRASEAKKKK